VLTPNRFEAFAPPHIQKLTAYDPGFEPSDIKRQLGLSEMVELGSNENCYGPAPSVCTFLAAPYGPQSDAFAHRYPDAGGRLLKRAIAEQLTHAYGQTFEPAQITLGNGTHELLTLIAETFCNPGDAVLHAQYGFAVYSLAAKGAGAVPQIAPVAADFSIAPEALLAAITPATKLVYLANPNNPTGSYWNHAALSKFLDALPAHVLFVLDEAYAEFADAPDFPQGPALLAQHPQLIVARTFSKAYGLANLRVGYTIAHPDFVQILERTRLSFNVNGIALRAAALAIADQTHIASVRAQNAQQRQQLQEKLSQRGLHVLPSQGNFLLIDFQVETAPIAAALLQLGVVVRPMKPYGLPQFLRFTVGTTQENAKLLASLDRVRA
jgi:histidinol-phosphate aminotransferase